MNDWLAYIGEHIDKIEWSASDRVWEISNGYLNVKDRWLGDALALFERKWRELND